MSKDTTTKQAEGKRKSLVEVLETDYEDKDEVTLLLEQGMALKQQIGVAPDEKKGVEGSGLLKELDDIKEKLTVHQKVAGLEGLRHNHIAFVLSHRDGRETMDPKKLAEELAAEGIDVKVVAECMKRATSRGPGYYVRELVDLNVKRGKRDGEWN